ncbi:phage protein D [Sphingobium sp. JAI105]|uniref:contractile injection system protein, VgrG/Pvc8 family n=1 Tax=Sphingobium sp. JAI105 TaxID=2787715 RepID=UPI0018C9B68B|nr:contractile injection system protein, VgrG/Pvc8 family [Sphingobium sp. JAI105]MBG6118786.1 phage protein D [Sphingobium sp. JAI105]
MTANKAGARLTLDGVDLADKINPRLVELTLTEKRGGEADELSVTLQNADGKLAMPDPGKVLALALGWEQGDDVPVGLVDKGRFKVDEVEASGPPDRIMIRARSADLSGSYRQRRTKSWKGTTLGAVLTEIAARHGITAQVHPDLAGKPIAALDQNGKSDMAMVRDLGSRYDALATWKDRRLIFIPVGSATTANGNAIPSLTLTRQDGWSWSFIRAQRDENDGVEAEWHDQAAGRRKKHATGGNNPKRLKRVYATEADATQAAEAEAKKRARGGCRFEYDLAIADCRITPNRRVRLKGWNSTIDGAKWVVEAIETTISATRLRQKIQLESSTA